MSDVGGDDEEWGWGDEEDDGGHLEMASTSSDSMHKRRSSSNESYNRSVRTAPANQSSFKRASPRSGRGNKAMDHNLPSIPQVPTSGIGLSLTAPSAKPGLSLSKPKSVVAAAPATAPARPPDFGNLGGMKITSLGPKRAAPTPTKKAPTPAPVPEDDIFASMGLVAKPKFSHAPPPVHKTPATTTSRWAPPATAATTAPSSVIPTASINLDADAGDGDDNWDDDADLDDLFDD